MGIHTTNDQTMPQESTIKRMNVMVLDDSEVDRKTIIRLCNRAGLNCTFGEADSLHSLSIAMDHTSFDLIFIDYLLGHESGLDAVKMALEHETQTSAAAIMVAGEGQIDIAVEAMRLGCADYLTKSMLTVDALQKSIATAIERTVIKARFAQEAHTRKDLESTIKRYAEASTAEMRTLLSATLRRVRLMRKHEAGPDFVHDLRILEVDIDMLWKALPNFRANVTTELPSRPKPKTLLSHQSGCATTSGPSPNSNDVTVEAGPITIIDAEKKNAKATMNIKNEPVDMR